MRLLVILDGAAEPPHLTEPTAFELAATPALDALAARGALLRMRATPAGLPAGSETGIPTLLGAPPRRATSRGLVEAAAAGLHVGRGEQAWRVDLHHRDGTRASAARARAAVRHLGARLPDHALHHLRGHRLLAIGPDAPVLHRDAGLDLHVWGEGAPLAEALDERTAIVCAPGAAAGVGALLGARVVIPAGATGDVDSNLAAKAEAALALTGEADTIVVHVGAPDEAAHRRDPEQKAAALHHADRDVVDPLAAWASRNGAIIAVTADHGTDPRTGIHDPAPTPLVVAGPGVLPSGGDTLTERAVAREPIVTDPFAPGWAGIPSA